jgi:hypothetical protein
MGLVGCGPIHTGPLINHGKINQIVEGQTTKSEVIALFGNMPSTQTRDSSGTTTLTWVHTRSDYNYWLGIYLPAASDAVTVVFDRNDIVQRYSYGGHQNTREVWHEPYGQSSTPPDVGVEQTVSR